MKRLTKRDEFGNADIIGVNSTELQLNLGFNELNKVTNALNRLAEYEELEEQGKSLKRKRKANKKEKTEIMQVIKYLWAATDQAEIMDIVELAFAACPYETQKEILDRLYEYGVEAYNSKMINPGFDETEFCEFLERAEKIMY